MKLLANLLIAMGLGSFIIGVSAKFCGTIIFIQNPSPIAFVVVGNAFLLLALILKLAND